MLPPLILYFVGFRQKSFANVGGLNWWILWFFVCGSLGYECEKRIYFASPSNCRHLAARPTKSVLWFRSSPWGPCLPRMGRGAGGAPFGTEGPKGLLLNFLKGCQAHKRFTPKPPPNVCQARQHFPFPITFFQKKFTFFLHSSKKSSNFAPDLMQFYCNKACEYELRARLNCW